jgi:hypoxia up-regulated 1
MMTFNRMLVLATMIFMGLTTASAQLIGVDTGSMYFKVALVKPGSPFQIVTNVHSKRKTETILGFEDAERRFGGDAVTLASRRPQQAIAFVPRLLGRSTKHPALERLASQYLPFLVEEDAARGTANLTVQGGGSAEDPDISLSPEEAMAMILTHAKSNADRFSGGRVTDAVLTVPSYFTVSERDAMRDAAHIAGLKVLSLIEENTAAALQYGISRIFPNETHTVLIYNMGASSTQVSVFEFTTYTAKKSGKNQTFGQFETIGKSWDENLGGFAFDLKLVEFMADAFNGMKQRKGKKDVRTNHRSMAKLRKSAEKVKKVLSANKQYPITIESLCDDMDFRGTSVTREQFEKMTEDLMDRVLGPVERALEMANRTIDQISQVEIIGGGVRVPKVQELLADFFQLKAVGDLGVHLNGDEAMALGAAFRAANMSKAFRVGRAERSVGMIESTYFPIGLRLEELEKTSATAEKEGEAADGEDAEVAKTDAEAETEADTEGEGKTRKKWSKRVSLFSRKSELLKKKKIKLTHDHDFTVTLKYDSHSKAPMDESIGNVFREFNITGLEKFATGDKKHLGTPQVELVFQLDSNGVPIITKAEAKLEEIVIEAPKEEKKEESEESNDEESKDEETKDEETKDEETKDEEAKDEETKDEEAKDEETKDEETKDEEAKDEEAKDEEAKDEETKEDGEKKSDDDKAEEKKKPKKPKTKKRIHRVQLKVTQVVSSAQTVRRMTAKDAKDASRRLRDMEAADELRQKRDAEKNSLESFVFEIRGQVRDNEEDLSKVSPVSFSCFV